MLFGALKAEASSPMSVSRVQLLRMRQRRQVPLFVGQMCIPKGGLVYVFPLQIGVQIVTATIPTIKLTPDFQAEGRRSRQAKLFLNQHEF